jgi:hypothetical protein
MIRMTDKERAMQWLDAYIESRDDLLVSDVAHYLTIKSALLHTKQGEWQSIETAPKDGAWILLYAPPMQYERQTGQQYIARWEKDRRYGDKWVYGPSDDYGNRTEVCGAIFWMPLPMTPGESND